MNKFILLLILTGMVFTSQAQVVKQSTSGICHDTGSPYYRSLKHFTSYDSMSACLQHNGRQRGTKVRHVAKPTTTAHSSTASGAPHYSRSQFGKGWEDVDHDCQNTRTEVLIKQNTGQITFKTKRHCRVTKGRWISAYSGQVIYQASKVDIDHIVPLSWAWQHGANHWPKTKREQFANDLVNLVSVEASLNRQKGDKGPTEWLPPKNQCAYLLRFKRITKKYGLPFSDNVLKQKCKHYSGKPLS